MATHVSEQEARQVAEAARETEWKLPSFGKGLFLGDFQPDLIYPQPEIDPREYLLSDIRNAPRLHAQLGREGRELPLLIFRARRLQQRVE